MSDIVERLRADMDKYPGFENMNTEAATEIERLRARVADLEETVRFNEDQRRMLFDAATTLEADRDRWKAEALAWRKRAKYDGSKGEFNAIKMSDADIEVQSARAANGEVGQ